MRLSLSHTKRTRTNTMNRYCVICDRYTPSHLRMTWHEDEGGYCCPSCAEAELLKIRDDDYFEDDGELEAA